MESVLLFEDGGVHALAPLTHWRTVFELRLAREILLDRVTQIAGRSVAGVWVREEMAAVATTRCGVPANQTATPGVVLLNGRWLCPTDTGFPSAPCAGYVGDEVAFIVCDKALARALNPQVMLQDAALAAALAPYPRHEAAGTLIHYPWDLITHLSEHLIQQWNPEQAAPEEPLSDRAESSAGERVHLGLRASIHPTAVLSVDAGPVFIGQDARIGAHSVIEGPAYIGPGSIINPHAWLHGGCAIGPMCKIGGEVDSCVFHGYSNKQHTGFLGHSYVGSWVNLGAGCTNSDLKNTYGTVRMRAAGRDMDTGVQFLGSIIADHAKVGINATLPTGSVIGLGANIVAPGIAPKFLPSFGWFDGQGVQAGEPRKLLEVARSVMARRDVQLSDAESELFLQLPALCREIDAAAPSG